MIDEKKFVAKADSEIKKYGILKDAFQKIAKVEANLYEKRKKAFDMIKGLKEMDNLLLSDIYLNFTTEMSGLEEFRKVLLSKINDKILPATVFYPTKAKGYKQNIGHYGDIKKQKEKEQNEKIKAQSNSQTEKAKSLQNEIARKEDIMYQSGQSIEKDFLKFEADRVLDNKYLFLNFIHSELAYHAAALEKLSALYKKIQDIEPIEKLEEFVNKYSLTSVGDLREYGYDKRKIERKNKKEAESKNDMPESIQNSNLGDDLSNHTGQKKTNVKSILDDDMIEGNNQI